MENGKSNVIVSISAQDIYQHPDNPRKDLGDLSELSDSIAKKGIMQNLTVIPGHWLTDEEWSAAAKEYQETPNASEELRELLNKRWTPEGYTLIIGHRRFAAAKLAGIQELPCRVVEDMDKKDQVSTMLEENMQRTDLTIWEQASGFQMMLDLGETEEQIAEKSGFSRTTVRRRLNIAKLDQNILREKEASDSFRLSLKDLYELEKVEDIATRNKILADASSSRDIVWRAQNAVSEAARKKREAAIVKLLEEAGIEKVAKYEQERYSGKWDIVKEYSLDKDAPKSLGIPKKEKGKLYYGRHYSSIHVIKASAKKKETAEERARKEIDARKKQIKAVMKEMNNRKYEFISNILSGKIAPIKDTAEVREEIWFAMVKMGSYMSMSGMRRFFTGKDEYQCSQEEKEEAANKVAGLSMEHQMLLVMSSGLDNEGDVYDYYLHHNAERCEGIKAAYAVLEKYGWSFTEEESQILNGTHEFYVPEEKKEGEK